MSDNFTRWANESANANDPGDNFACDIPDRPCSNEESGERVRVMSAKGSYPSDRMYRYKDVYFNESQFGYIEKYKNNIFRMTMKPMELTKRQVDNAIEYDLGDEGAYVYAVEHCVQADQMYKYQGVYFNKDQVDYVKQYKGKMFLLNPRVLKLTKAQMDNAIDYTFSE